MNPTPNGMHASVEARNRENLLRKIAAAKEDVGDARDRLHDAEQAYDDFEWRNRPHYPTTAQLLALEKAVEDVKDGFEPPSHLGRQISDGVSAHGKQGFIWVNAKAPYGRAANGRLWKLDSAEIQKILDHVKALGVTVTEWWPHEEGMSMKVRVR